MGKIKEQVRPGLSRDAGARGVGLLIDLTLLMTPRRSFQFPCRASYYTSRVGKGDAGDIHPRSVASHMRFSHSSPPGPSTKAAGPMIEKGIPTGGQILYEKYSMIVIDR